MIVVVVLCATSVLACPEVIVPLDRKDTALRSSRWKRPLQTYRARKFKPALKQFRRTSKAIGSEVNNLFHPEGESVSNRIIQKWLQRHMYTRYPSILESQDGFTFPVLVWWAWADTACRQGEYAEAARALERLAAMRPSSDVRFHQTVVAIHQKQWKRAQHFFAQTRPDRFLTPWAEGIFASKTGDWETARTKLQRAADGAYMPERRQAALHALKQFVPTVDKGDSPKGFR